MIFAQASPFVAVECRDLYAGNPVDSGQNATKETTP